MRISTLNFKEKLSGEWEMYKAGGRRELYCGEVGVFWFVLKLGSSRKKN